ncbi:MAG: aminotransferase class III-fold pyridoxal phosphate-dependent enzyme [Pirellulales bacterium]
MDDAEAARFFEQQLRGFVPPSSFDFHVHLYRHADGTDALPRHVAEATGDVGWNAYQQAARRWMGDRTPTAGLAFGIPKPRFDFAGANRFVVEQLPAASDSRALLVIHPGDDPATVEAAIDADPYVGFKVYHLFADCADTFQAAPDEFIPEWACELADARGLVLMLHLVRHRALADATNQRYLNEQCRRFSNVRWVLAHAGRGFCGAHTVEGVRSLRGIENLYFDTSAICESQPIEAILRTFGPRRLLFGTDFPISELVGRAVSIADGFLWLGETNVDWSSSQFAAPTLVGIESLLAIRQACRSVRLNDTDVEGIFRGNAATLLGPAKEIHSAPAHGGRGRLPASFSGRLSGEADPHASNRTEALYRTAKLRIPGGTQLLSKRPEMYAPGRWPAYFSEARGCQIVDLDGRTYRDMTTSGIGCCLLGYADPEVTAAVIRRVELGSMCTLNAAEEVLLAERLVALHPWAEQVRYCRTGGESMAVAVRIARAHVGCDRVAFCGYHGWSDWYLAANLCGDGAGAEREGDPLRGHLLPGLEPRGVPQGLAGTATPFAYNRLDQLEQIVRESRGGLAAVVMEPTRSTDPEPGFLEGVRDLCDDCGAVLIFDEITSGWRLHLGGAHLRYGVHPDLAIYAKAIGNGHPMGAVIGRSRVMQAAQSTFISSTYWTEAVGPAAALATIGKMQRIDLPEHVRRIGRLLRNGLNTLGEKYGLPVRVTGHDALLHIGFETPDAAALGTLLTTRMLDQGYLVGSGFYPSLAHTEAHVAGCIDAADPVFAELADALQQGDLRQRIGGQVRHSGFARLT